MSSLNIVIKKYAADWKKTGSNIIRSMTDITLEPVKYTPNPASLHVIAEYFSQNEAQVWQQLEREKKSEMAATFKSRCAPQGKIIIEQFQKSNLKVSLSHNSLQLIQNACMYFNSRDENEFKQYETIIRELCVKYLLFDSLQFVVNLHDRPMEVLVHEYINTENVIAGKIRFPQFSTKVLNLIKTFCKVIENAEARQLIDYMVSLNPGSHESSVDCKEALRKELPTSEEIGRPVSSGENNSTVYGKIKFLLTCWEVDAPVIDELVPSQIADFTSLEGFDFAAIKESSLGKRKQWNRAKTAYFSNPKQSSLNLKVSFPELSTDQLCNWFAFVELPEYIPLITNSNITGLQLSQFTSEDLRNLGVAVLGHRKLILRALVR